MSVLRMVVAESPSSFRYSSTEDKAATMAISPKAPGDSILTRTTTVASCNTTLAAWAPKVTAPPRTERPRISASRWSVARVSAASDGFKLLLPHRSAVLDIPAIGRAHAVLERDARPPAERRQPRNVDEFTRRAVGLGRIEGDRAAEPGDAADQRRQIGNRDFLAGADIDDLVGRIGLHQMHQRVSAVIDVQELAQRPAGTPDLEHFGATPDRVVGLGDQRREDMARAQVEIVAGTVEIGRRRGDEVATMLPAVGLDQFDAGDLGDGIPLVGRLERVGEECILAHRLWREPRINAGRAE